MQTHYNNTSHKQAIIAHHITLCIAMAHGSRTCRGDKSGENSNGQNNGQSNAKATVNPTAIPAMTLAPKTMRYSATNCVALSCPNTMALNMTRLASNTRPWTRMETFARLPIISSFPTPNATTMTSNTPNSAITKWAFAAEGISTMGSVRAITKTANVSKSIWANDKC